MKLVVSRSEKLVFILCTAKLVSFALFLLLNNIKQEHNCNYYNYIPCDLILRHPTFCKILMIFMHMNELDMNELDTSYTNKWDRLLYGVLDLGPRYKDNYMQFMLLCIIIIRVCKTIILLANFNKHNTQSTLHV